MSCDLLIARRDRHAPAAIVRQKRIRTRYGTLWLLAILFICTSRRLLVRWFYERNSFRIADDPGAIRRGDLLWVGYPCPASPPTFPLLLTVETTTHMSHRPRQLRVALILA